MPKIEVPITLDEQVLMMKKYVSFKQRKKMRNFLNYAGYFRTSRYGKFLLSHVSTSRSFFKQNDLFALYQFDVDLRRTLNYYCNKIEIRFKSALSNACAIYTKDSIFYLDKSYYTASKGESDSKIRRKNINLFNSSFFNDIICKENSLRQNVRKYPELKEYRKGGSRHNNRLPIWITFNYIEFGTVTKMFNYLRGDLRKKVLEYAFNKNKYSKRDTELVDTWLDAVRNLRNYCAHNSMVLGIKSSVVLIDYMDDLSILPQDNDLFSRIYAMKKLLSDTDAQNLKKDLQSLIRKAKIDIFALDILSTDWESQYDKIHIF